MARPTAHLCAHPGCPTILDHGPGRCPQHGATRSGTRGYGSAWRRTRDAFIAQHPTCERCPAPALDVHHRDGRHPTQPGANDWTNLQALCRSCHRRITEHTKRARGGGATRSYQPREQAHATRRPNSPLGAR